MICEKCGCHDRVTRTVHRDDKVIRIRRCHNCGNMVETEEKAVEVPTTVGSRKQGRKKRDLPPPPPTETADCPTGQSADMVSAISLS